MILTFYKLFSLLPLPRKYRSSNYIENQSAWKEYKTTHPNLKYIEDQPKLKSFRYGKKYSADYNSCEVIAVYNALISAQNLISYPRLLRYFEANGITCFGAFGTSPFALEKMLNKLNFKTETIKLNSIFHKSKLEKGIKKILKNKQDLSQANEDSYIKSFQENHDAFILMSYNSKSIFDMIHTMCITKEGNNFQIHNDYNGSKIYPSLCETIVNYNNKKSRPIIIIGIDFPK